MAYKKKSKKHQIRPGASAIVHVKSNFNNTVLTATDENGDVVSRGSGGKLGYKGSRKGTPFVATQIATGIAKELLDMGVRTVSVKLQGPGSGRDSAIRALQAAGLTVTTLCDVTPLPHNGCRPPKKARN